MARPKDPNARPALVAAARTAFAARGLQATRIEDITAACGLSKGAFYLHFESKEALFHALLEDFRAALEASTQRRQEAVLAFGAKHGKAILAGKAMPGSALYEALLELEVGLDLVTLEILWSHRDLVGVLISGTQGTEFAGVIWSILEAEVQRVAEHIRRLRGAAAEVDVVPELCGAMVVGTYFLVAKQFTRVSEKAALETLARMLHRLVHEGVMGPVMGKALGQPVAKTTGKATDKAIRDMEGPASLVRLFERADVARSHAAVSTQPRRSTAASKRSGKAKSHAKGRQEP